MQKRSILEQYPDDLWEKVLRKGRCLPCEICGEEATVLVRLSRMESMILCNSCASCTQFGGPVTIYHICPIEGPLYQD